MTEQGFYQVLGFAYSQSRSMFERILDAAETDKTRMAIIKAREAVMWEMVNDAEMKAEPDPL